jgi:hypothetical protein
MIYSGSVSAQPSEERLLRFLEESRRRNLRDGLFGVMVLIGHDFLQVIEGPEDNVERYRSEAFSDHQRYHLTLLAKHHIETPIFGAWSLGFIRAELNMDANAPGAGVLLQIEQLNPENPQEHHTLRLIREFIDGKWHHHLPGANNIIVRR